MIKLSSLTFSPVRWAPAEPAILIAFRFLLRRAGRHKAGRRDAQARHPQGTGARANCPTKLSKNPAAQLQQATLTRPTILQHPAALSSPLQNGSPSKAAPSQAANRPSRLEPLIMGLPLDRVNNFLKEFSKVKVAGKFDA